MTVKDCILAKKAAGLVDGARAKAAADLFDELEAEATARMGPEGARAWAGAETRRIIQQQTNTKNRQLLLQTVAAGRLQKDLAGWRDTKGQKSMGKALESLIEHRPDSAAAFSSVQGRYKAVLGQAHSLMADTLERFRHGLLGRSYNAAQLDNVVRELYGEATGDMGARAYAQAWGEAAEFVRLRRNQAGGAHIAKRADWGLPQSHDTLLVRQVGRGAWVGFTIDLLDSSKMVDGITGKAFTRAQLKTALESVYGNIRTQGWASRVPSSQPLGKKLANRRLEHRFLVFKDPASWLEYNQKFGERDIFTSMTHHLDSMSREISELEILGPNPDASLRLMRQMVEKDAAGARAAVQAQAKKSLAVSETMMQLYRGSLNDPINAKAARVMGGTRNLLTSVQLGAAVLSAASDMAFMATTARYNGLSATRAMRRMLGHLAGGENKRLAVRAGLIAEDWTENALGMQRYMNESGVNRSMQLLPNATIRLSGLSAYTQAGRHAFGMEVMATLAENAGKKFDDLDPLLQSLLTRYSLDGQWDAIRASTPYKHKGAVFIRPEDISTAKAATGDDLATRYLEMIKVETEFAVPKESLRARAFTTGGTRPGTWPGELVRAVGMYKSFPVTIMMTHMRRALAQPGAHKWKYSADLMIGMTIMGAFAMQLKQMVAGKDPRPMTGKNAQKFWGAAMLQGGGLGLAGDLLFSDVNRFGGGLPTTIAGPVVALADDMRNLTVGNLMELTGGENTNFNREAVKFFSKYTPGKSIWYARLMLERELFDRMQYWADPVHARQQWRKREANTAKNYGQQFWWRPGKTTPDRAPDIENVAGN